jgi:hypothetical protein
MSTNKEKNSPSWKQGVSPILIVFLFPWQCFDLLSLSHKVCPIYLSHNFGIKTSESGRPFCVPVIFKCRHQQCTGQTHFFSQESGSDCCVLLSQMSRYPKARKLSKTKGHCLSLKNDSSVVAFNTKNWSREK